MRRKLMVLATAVALFMLSVVTHVHGDGYEATPVGGVLDSTNSVMTLTQAAVLGIAIFGFVVLTVLIRIKKH